jgi:hypothetical protein
MRRCGEPVSRHYAATAEGAAAGAAIDSLSPQTDLQRSLKARAMQIITDLAQTRLLLFESSSSSIPTAFLTVLIFWLAMIFVSFSLFSHLHDPCRCAFRLCVVSGRRDFLDSGLEPAVHGMDTHFQRAARTLATRNQIEFARPAEERSASSAQRARCNADAWKMRSGQRSCLTLLSWRAIRLRRHAATTNRELPRTAPELVRRRHGGQAQP